MERQYSAVCAAAAIVAGVLGFGRLTSNSAAAEPLTGEQIYRKLCASCHGQSGEGAKAYPRALSGEKPIPLLSKLIVKTMPEDNPGSLKPEEADKVAAYVHDTFYSLAARERNKPPRIELARLTVGQYRNAVADLIGSFRTPTKIDNREGLRGEYFNARNFRNNVRLVDRIDPDVRFDFGTDGPIADKFDPLQFCIRWEGSVTAPESGNYEFIVRTEHAARLWVNDLARPLLDQWVKSGNETEFRETIYLIGGRSYPIRLEFSKAKQGVDDSAKIKVKPKVHASVGLLWKPPGKAPETIPARHLNPNKANEVFVAGTPFPPDDRSVGWEKGTTVSKAWDQATTDAAIETAAYVAAKINDLAGTRDGAADREARIRDFASRLVERAFRRPLPNDQRRLYVDRHFDATKNPDEAVRRVVLLALKSPRFLYRESSGDTFDTASRLAFVLWDAPPDEELLKAVAQGQLESPDEIRKQAERMLADPRAKAKLRHFMQVWAKIDQPPDIAKDARRFQGFDAAAVADLRTSLDLFFDDVTWSDTSDFRRLLLDDFIYVNGRLAELYDAPLPADPVFRKVRLNANQRAGILTHPYMLSAFAYTGTSSPIHRGVFIARGVLGLTLRPPNEAFTPLAEELHPNLTTRERVALQTRPAACVSCHGVINPLGFTLENFDAIGRLRDKENGKPIDTSGSYQTRVGETKPFKNVRELARFLADSDEVHSAFTEQMFHHLVKQPVRAYGPTIAADLRQSFAKSQFNIRKLAVEIAVVAALPAKGKR
jgi:Protein of unknown function (DUF1592)/Protein of unknown function (DUF1588)/PA14 domain/Cytochrome C oxidase, cbb3-type, subunit III